MTPNAIDKAIAAMDQSLRQWKMYSEIQNASNEDLDTAQHPEGQLYRHCKEALTSLKALKESLTAPAEIKGLDTALMNAVKPCYREGCGEWVLYCGTERHAQAILDAARAYSSAHAKDAHVLKSQADALADALGLAIYFLDAHQEIKERSSKALAAYRGATNSVN